MTLIIERADPNEVMFETRLVEQVSAEAQRTARKLGNRLTCGVPRVFDLAKLYAGLEASPPLDLAKEMQEHGFWLLRLVFSLHDDPRSAVRWVELGVTLDYSDTASGPPASLSDLPIVHDLFPLSEEDKVTAKRSNKLTGKLTFAPFVEGSAEHGLVLEYEQLIPTIRGYGKRESAAYWRFLPGVAESKVKPGVKEMDMVVRRDPGRPVTCTVRVRGAGLRWGLFSDPVTPANQVFRL